ncbi:hypothetical protein ACO2Q9_06825 [Variovorax sp. VNK109]|uniref:hypothetical protein n=1 Tax=Variovorax sp. VNK109 TaxID=3400919 RepID=UPI003C0D1DFD
MKTASARLRLALVMLAWLAQAFMPFAHAMAMSAPKAVGQVWCGEPASAKQALASLPQEVRDALAEEGGVSPEHLASCAMLCGVGAAYALPFIVVSTNPMRVDAGLPGLSPPTPPTASRPQSPTPPAHAPPVHG